MIQANIYKTIAVRVLLSFKCNVDNNFGDLIISLFK